MLYLFDAMLDTTMWNCLYHDYYSLKSLSIILARIFLFSFYILRLNLICSTCFWTCSFMCLICCVWVKTLSWKKLLKVRIQWLLDQMEQSSVLTLLNQFLSFYMHYWLLAGTVVSLWICSWQQPRWLSHGIEIFISILCS